MPRIFSIFATIVDTSLCLYETGLRVRTILLQIHQSAPQLFQQAVATLGAGEQEKLKTLMEKGPTNNIIQVKRIPLV